MKRHRVLPARGTLFVSTDLHGNLEDFEKLREHFTRVSAQTQLDLRVVVHGHDRDESGWFVEGGNQVQPVIFGAPHEHKRYLRLDLSARFDTPEALREGVELLRLY